VNDSLSRGIQTLRAEGASAFLFKVWRHVRWQLSRVAAAGREEAALVASATQALRRAAAGATDAARAFSVANRFVYRGIKIWPWQIRSEILGFLDLLEGDPPRRVLEIGTAEGGTLFLLTRMAAPDSLVVSIDLPEGEFGGGYPAWRARLYEGFATGAQRVELIRASSHDPATVQRVLDLMGGELLDVAFIDGDHRYEGVRNDFELYSPLVREGGVIAFHDIVPDRAGEASSRFVGGVPAFWRELKASRPVMEFVDDWGQSGRGIGVVVKQS